VASGLGAYFNVDPIVFRIAFVGPAGGPEAAGQPQPAAPDPGWYQQAGAWGASGTGAPPPAGGPPPTGRYPPPGGGAPPPPGAGAPPGGPGGPPGGHGGAAPWRRLTRRMDGRMLAGVASGLGAYFNVDPIVFRIAFVVLTFTGGVGLLLYAALWIAVPPAGASESIGQAALRRPNARTWIGLVLVLIAISVLSGELGLDRPGVIWGLVLIAVGVMLLRREPSIGAGGPYEPGGDRSATGGPGQAGASPAGPPPAGWGGGPATAGWGPPPPAGASVASPSFGGPPSSGVLTGGGAPPGDAATTARAWGEPPPEGWTVGRSRSNLGWVTLAVAFLAVGVAAFLNNVGMAELTIGRILALFLTVIGVGLVVGAVLHQRSILLVLFGVLLIPVVMAASVLDVPLRGGAGPRRFQPLSVADIRDRYELAAGDLVIDLTDVHFGKEATLVRARVGAGRVAVYLPEDVPVEMKAKTGIGVAQFLGRRYEGGVQVTANASAPGSERIGLVTLDLEAGYGFVQVVRGEPPPDWDQHASSWGHAQDRPPVLEEIR
jgi:phage shock protein PspC (stress-responsive transcriptional regulator)